MASGKQRKKYVAAGARAPVVLPAACPVSETLRSRLGEPAQVPAETLSQLRKLHADMTKAKSSSVQAKLLAGLPGKSVAALAKGLQASDDGQVGSSFVELQAWLVYLCMLAVSVSSKPLQRQALRAVANCFKGGADSLPAAAAEAAVSVWASWLLQQAVSTVGLQRLQSLKGLEGAEAAAMAAVLAAGADEEEAAQAGDGDDLTFGAPEPTPAAAAAGADEAATRTGYTPIGEPAAAAEALPPLGWPDQPCLSGIHEIFITLPQARRTLLRVAAPADDDVDGLAYLAMWPAHLLISCMAKLGPEPSAQAIEALADGWGGRLAGDDAGQQVDLAGTRVPTGAGPASTAHFPTVAQEAAAASRLLEGLAETMLQLPQDHAALAGSQSALARALRRGVGCAALVLGNACLSPTLRAVADGGGAMLQDTLSSFARAVTVTLAAHARVSQAAPARRSSPLLAWAQGAAAGLPPLPRLSVTPALAAAAQSASAAAATSPSMTEAARCGPAIAAVASADASDAALVAFALKQLRVWADWAAKEAEPGEGLRGAAMESVAQAAGWLGHQDKRVQGFARDAFGALLKLAMAATGGGAGEQQEDAMQQWEALLQSCVRGHATGASLWPIVAAMLSAAPPLGRPSASATPAALQGWQQKLQSPAATVLRTIPDIVAALCGGGHLAAESAPAGRGQQAVNVEGGATTARARRDATVLVLDLLRMLRTELAAAAGLEVGPRGMLQRPSATGEEEKGAGSKETSKSRRRRRAREHAEAARRRLEADPAAHQATDAAVEEAATAVETAWAQVWVPAVASLLVGTSPAATSWEVSRVAVQSLVKPLIAGGGALTKVAVRMLVDTLVNPSDPVDAGRLGEGDDHLPADPMDRGQSGRRLWAAVAVLRVARSAGLVAVADLFGSDEARAQGASAEPAAVPPSLPAAEAPAPTRPRRRRFTQQSPRLAAAIAHLQAARRQGEPALGTGDHAAPISATNPNAVDFAALLRRAISHPAVPVRKAALALLAHAGPRAPPLSVREAQLLSRCAAAWTAEGAGSKERLSALLQPALLRARDSARATIKRVRWLRQLGLAIVKELGGQEVEVLGGDELPAVWLALVGTRVEVPTVASSADGDDANESSDPVLRPGGPMHAAVAAEQLAAAAEEEATAASIELTRTMLADCWQLGAEQAALDRLGESPSLQQAAAALPARSALLHLFTVGWLADDMARAAVACIEPGAPGLRASAGCELGLALMQVFGWGSTCPCEHATDPRVGDSWSLPNFPGPFLRPLGALASATAQWRLVAALRAGTGAIRRLAERWLLQLPFSADAAGDKGGPTTQQLAHLALWLTRSPRSAEAESGSHLLRVLAARWQERKRALGGASLAGVEAAVTEAVRASLAQDGAMAAPDATTVPTGSAGMLGEVVGVARSRVEAMQGALAAGLGGPAVAAAERTAASAFVDGEAAAGPAGVVGVGRGNSAGITPSLAAAGRTLLGSGGSALPHGSLLSVRRAIELAGRGDLKPREVLWPLLLAFRLSLLVVGGADDPAPQPSEGSGNEVLLGPELTSWARQTGE